MPEPGLVILRVERPRPVEVGPGTRVDTAHGHEMERRRLHGVAALQASSSVLALKALTVGPRVSAARRTCLASWSSSEIVVLMMHTRILFALALTPL
jgi:hypothetical protein